jgi:hypothetical protein
MCPRTGTGRKLRVAEKTAPFLYYLKDDQLFEDDVAWS